MPLPWKRHADNDAPAVTYAFPRCVGGKEPCQQEEEYECFASLPAGLDA